MGEILAVVPTGAGAYVVLRSERAMRAGTVVLFSFQNEKRFGVIEDCTPHDDAFYIGLSVAGSAGFSVPVAASAGGELRAAAAR